MNITTIWNRLKLGARSSWTKRFQIFMPNSCLNLGELKSEWELTQKSLMITLTEFHQCLVCSALSNTVLTMWKASTYHIFLCLHIMLQITLNQGLTSDNGLAEMYRLICNSNITDQWTTHPKFIMPLKMLEMTPRVAELSGMPLAL